VVLPTAFGIVAGAELDGLPNVDVLSDIGVNLVGWLLVVLFAA
jgi:hypothetical protein